MAENKAPQGRVMALELAPGPLDEAMQAYFAKCEEKLGFVPNVLHAYSFDLAKLKAFVAMADDLMLAPSGLSKLEREMIAVVVSCANHCHYCLVAHGAVVRRLSGDPVLAETLVANYRAAKLDARTRAMLDFTLEAHGDALADRGGRPRGLAQGRLLRARHLGHRGGGGLLRHVEPHLQRDRKRTQSRILFDAPLKRRRRNIGKLT